MTHKVELYLTGRTLGGADPQTVAPALARMLKLTDERAAALLQGKRTVLRKEIAQEDAGRYIQALQKAGAEVGTRPLDDMPAAAASTPAPHPPAATAAPAATGLANPWLLLDDVPELQHVPAWCEQLPASAFVLPPPPVDEPLAFVPPALPTLVAAPPSAPPASTPATEPGTGLMLEEPVTTVTCPACGEVQPKRNLCRACAVNMTAISQAQKDAVQDEAEHAEAERTVVLSSARLSPLARDHSAGDDDDGVRLLSLSFSGRIGRIRFLAHTFLIALFVGLLIVLMFVVFRTLSVLKVGAMFYCVMLLRAVVLRLHDLNRSAMWVIGFIVAGVLVALAHPPLVQWYTTLGWLALIALPGDDDRNDFGEPPTGPRPLEYVIVLLFLVLGGIGFVNKPQQIRGAHLPSSELRQPGLLGTDDLRPDQSQETPDAAARRTEQRTREMEGQ